MPFPEPADDQSWQFNIVTNRHKITGERYVPRERTSKNRPKDSFTLEHFKNHPFKNPIAHASIAHKTQWREHNIISNKYFKHHERKSHMDRVFAQKSCKQKLYDTHPFNPIEARWKHPPTEKTQAKKEKNVISDKLQTWQENKTKEINILHHNIINSKTNALIDSNSDKKPKYIKHKHPEVFHSMDCEREYRHQKKAKIYPQIYESSLRRNHHIITNEPWIGRGSIEFQTGKKMKLKNPVLWKNV